MGHLNWKSPVGCWEVTTEGDVEGRTVKKLGLWSGHIVDIAFALAPQSSYKLTFQHALDGNPVTSLNPKTKEVHIALSIESGTWNLKSIERTRWLQRFLRVDQPKMQTCEVWDSNFYAAVKLLNASPQHIEVEVIEKELSTDFLTNMVRAQVRLDLVIDDLGQLEVDAAVQQSADAGDFGEMMQDMVEVREKLNSIIEYAKEEVADGS